jgi:hypothetical protein
VLKHIIQFAQATLACVIMLAVVFSIPMVLAAAPVHVGVSVASWKDLLANRQAQADRQ